MCIKKGCTSYKESCHCCFQCNCDISCYTCYIAKKYYNTPGNPSFVHSNSSVRNKYICFNCKHIWKSSISKYIYHKVQDKCLDYQKYLITAKKERKDFIDLYYNNSKCAKCGNNGILVGRNFRHCKNDKEWKKLKENYKNNKIDLIKDFYDYPREGNEKMKNKFHEKMKNKLNDKDCEPIYNC